MSALQGKTIIITGASRGIGRAMALRFARDGANLVIAAKSTEPHPKLKGSIHEVAEEVQAAGGNALAVRVDVRDEQQVQAMVQATVEKFGGIDVLVNNAGAISLTSVEKTTPKQYDLMLGINARAVYLCSHFALPYLKQGKNPHILSLSPPINLDTRWLKPHAPYTLSKYGMTLLSLGMAAEFAAQGIAVNCLWPKTTIATAAIEFALGNKEVLNYCRSPEIMADAAHAIVSVEKRQLSGRCIIDEDILRETGVTNFDRYLHDPAFAGKLHNDLFIDG